MRTNSSVRTVSSRGAPTSCSSHLMEQDGSSSRCSDGAEVHWRLAQVEKTEKGGEERGESIDLDASVLLQRLREKASQETTVEPRTTK